MAVGDNGAISEFKT